MNHEQEFITPETRVEFIPFCETCGWVGEQTDDREQAITQEWRHIQQYNLFGEHRTRIKRLTIWIIEEDE